MRPVILAGEMPRISPRYAPEIQLILQMLHQLRRPNTANHAGAVVAHGQQAPSLDATN
jgi:hypothetical protein